MNFNALILGFHQCGKSLLINNISGIKLNINFR